ncbi:hypothetical protein AVEN_159143-1, partial [Araneus ventricosus]
MQTRIQIPESRSAEMTRINNPTMYLGTKEQAAGAAARWPNRGRFDNTLVSVEQTRFKWYLPTGTGSNQNRKSLKVPGKTPNRRDALTRLKSKDSNDQQFLVNSQRRCPGIRSEKTIRVQTERQQWQTTGQKERFRVYILQTLIK